MSDKGRIEVTGASIATLSAGLLQRYTNRNSWHCDKTAAITSEYCGSFRNDFPGPLSQNRFQEHNPASTYMNSAYRWKIFEVVLGCGHRLDIHLPI